MSLQRTILGDLHLLSAYIDELFKDIWETKNTNKCLSNMCQHAFDIVSGLLSTILAVEVDDICLSVNRT